jgi:imidazolonepropionase-like amidohydrolase
MLILKNARVLDAFHRDDDSRYTIVVEDGLIREVSSSAYRATRDDEVIDIGGRTLMPGLIDCHTHVIASVANLGVNAQLPNVFATLRAVPILAAILRRGFTTVRDVGGADYALARAVEEGMIDGPRLFVAGKALSQTGGHGDFRDRFDQSDADPCACNRNAGSIARVVDGVDNVRRAVREEMRGGASHIKIMASGGVASPNDPIANLQYSQDEIRAIVEEAASHQSYVAAHAYTPAAISRAVKLGVRTIEHGNLVNDEAAADMAACGAFSVPTLVTYDALDKVGAKYGVSEASQRKINDVRLQGIQSLEIYRRHDVPMAFGSDLLGEMHEFQSDEFLLRNQVLDPFTIICQATLVGAQVVRQEGRLGVVAPNAIADLLVVDGDPLKDLSLLCGQGKHLNLILKGGKKFHSEGLQ